MSVVPRKSGDPSIFWIWKKAKNEHKKSGTEYRLRNASPPTENTTPEELFLLNRASENISPLHAMFYACPQV